MKNQQDIFAKLKQILIDTFETEEDAITMDAQLYQDLDIDSIDAVDLVVQLRELTGQKIKPEDFKNVRTVRDVVEAIEALLAAE